MSKKAAKIAGYKKEKSKQVAELVKKHPIIGVVNMTNLPTPQLQRMREQLRGKVDLVMTKKTFIKNAFATIKDVPGINELAQYLENGQPALLFTNENPFSLFKTLKKSKSKAPAKAGQIAPCNIIVPAGPTSFAPGPIIGELGALGIKSKVEGGKIAIVSDSIVCKEGDVIKDKLAAMLARLGIEPMEIGLDLKAVLEKGVIYPKSILDIDEEKFAADLIAAAAAAHNLAIESSYACKDTAEELIMKAFREAKAVAKEGKIMCDIIAGEMVEQAEREMLSLKQEGRIETFENQRPVKQEGKKAEQKTEHTKKEDKPSEIPKQEAKAEENRKKEEPKKTNPHPKQGNVTHAQAQDLLKNLQQKGTLRE